MLDNFVEVHNFLPGSSRTEAVLGLKKTFGWSEKDIKEKLPFIKKSLELGADLPNFKFTGSFLSPPFTTLGSLSVEETALAIIEIEKEHMVAQYELGLSKDRPFFDQIQKEQDRIASIAIKKNVGAPITGSIAVRNMSHSLGEMGEFILDKVFPGNPLIKARELGLQQDIRNQTVGTTEERLNVLYGDIGKAARYFYKRLPDIIKTVTETELEKVKKKQSIDLILENALKGLGERDKKILMTMEEILSILHPDFITSLQIKESLKSLSPPNIDVPTKKVIIVDRDLIWNSPLQEAIKYCENGNSDEQFERFHELLKSIHIRGLTEINSATWDPRLICLVWENYIDKGFPHELNLGILQSLLKLDDLTPRLRKYIEGQGLEIIKEPLKVEVHLPHRAKGSWAGTLHESPTFVCDDFLPNVIKIKSNPFTALRDGDFSLDLEKFKGHLIDETHPYGKIGVVSINNELKVAFVDHPIISNHSNSRGILMPDQLYASGSNPMHPARINGVDANMDYILKLFKHFMGTGIDPSPGLRKFTKLT